MGRVVNGCGAAIRAFSSIFDGGLERIVVLERFAAHDSQVGVRPFTTYHGCVMRTARNDPPLEDDAVARILRAVEKDEPRAAEQVLPLVYDELRRLASARLALEASGQTLQTTALVHEAYLRLVGSDPSKPWDGRGHFFAAAAEAMRRILVERARRRRRVRHGGGRGRIGLDGDLIAPAGDSAADDLLALDEALDRLASEEPTVAEVVKLRYFAGLTTEQSASILGISIRTANRHWAYARAWLRQYLDPTA
jgi:RNA polymerase sigma factor (TIGR02999 family)